MAAAHDLLDGDSSRARPSEGLMPRAIRYLYQRLHEEEMQAQAEADAAAGTAADGDGSGTGGGDGESGFGEVGATGGAGAAPAGRRLGGASAPRVKTVVRVAMCELHNEAIYDLLNVTGEVSGSPSSCNTEDTQSLSLATDSPSEQSASSSTSLPSPPYYLLSFIHHACCRRCRCGGALPLASSRKGSWSSLQAALGRCLR